MLNSTMQSRKQEALLEMKQALVEQMAQKEMLRKTCEEKIEELQNRHIKWYGYYVAIGFAILGGISSFVFITYGYSDEAWIIFRNLIWVFIAGMVAYGFLILEQVRSTNQFLQQWNDVLEVTMKEMEISKKALKSFNQHLYV